MDGDQLLGIEGKETLSGHMRKLSRDIFIYGTGRVAVPLVGIVTLPILTRFFNPSDFGVLEGIATLSSVIALFSTLMLESSAQRSYYDHKETEEYERKKILSTSFWTIIIWNIIFFIPILLNSSKIGKLLFANGEYGWLLLISLTTIPIISLFNFLKEIFRLHNQSVRYSSFTVINAFLSAGMVILFISVFEVKLMGYFLGPLIGGIIILPIVIWSVRHDILYIFSWEELKKMLHYGLPLIPTNCSIWVLTLSDRFFLLKLTSLRELGLYAIGAKVAQIILLFVTAFGLAWSPFILSIYSRDKEEEKRMRGSITTYYICALALLAVFFTVFSRYILLLFTTKEFFEAHKVIGVLALATAAAGASQVLCTGINIVRKTKYLALFSMIAALSNIVLNAILIPPFGFMGAAVATAISYWFLCLLYYKKSQELYRSPYEPKKMIKMGILSCSVVLIESLISVELDPFIELVVRTLLFLSFPFSCFLWKVFDIREITIFKREIWNMLKMRRAQ